MNIEKYCSGEHLLDAQRSRRLAAKSELLRGDELKKWSDSIGCTTTDVRCALGTNGLSREAEFVLRWLLDQYAAEATLRQATAVRVAKRGETHCPGIDQPFGFTE